MTTKKNPTQAKLTKLLELYQRQKYDKAEKLATLITQEFPDHPFAWKILGLAFKAIGKKSEALIANFRAVKLSPQDPAVHNNLGNILQELGRLTEAETHLRQAIDLKSDFAEAHNNLGSILRELNRLDEAEASFRKAINLKAKYFEAYFSLGLTLYTLGRLEDASICYNQVIDLKSDFAEAHLYNGIILKELGRLEEAEASLRKAISLKNNLPSAYNNLGMILQEYSRLREAEASYRFAITLKDDYAEAHNNLGIILKELGMLDEAEVSFKNSIGFKPGYAQAHQNLGIMLLGLEKFDEAASHLKESGTVISNAYLLRCYYRLDQKSNFKSQLNKILNQGHNNALIGSLISQSNIRFGIHQNNPFCEKPLQYVREINLLNKYDFKGIFIKGVEEILKDKKVQYRKQDLLSNGMQTAGNIFTQSIEATNMIQKIIFQELDSYRAEFQDSTDGFITSWPNKYDLNGWLVSMKSGGKLDPHMHERGWISGSIYINVPPKSKPYSGNLVVGLDDAKNRFGKENYIKSIDVVTGSLCLFPSSLHHYTIPFESSEDRIVLAFDIIPRNKT